MDPLISYSLPISGMRDGLHQFDFKLDADFFSAFVESAYRTGTVHVHLDFDKNPSFFSLEFDIEGTLRTECDRCLEAFDLPIKAKHLLKVKFDEEEREEAEVVYILRDRQSLNVARFIYEFVHLSVPMAKTHDLAGESCNPEILKFLEDREDKGPDNDKKQSPWDELKNLNVR